MATKNQIIEVIYNCIDEVNLQNDTHIEKELNAKLFGKESDLDSLGLVNLIVSIEEAVNDEFNVCISIADEKALSQKNSPYKNVESLADYLFELLK